MPGPERRGIPRFLSFPREWCARGWSDEGAPCQPQLQQSQGLAARSCSSSPSSGRARPPRARGSCKDGDFLGRERGLFPATSCRCLLQPRLQQPRGEAAFPAPSRPLPLRDQHAAPRSLITRSGSGTRQLLRSSAKRDDVSSPARGSGRSWILSGALPPPAAPHPLPAPSPASGASEDEAAPTPQTS